MGQKRQTFTKEFKEQAVDHWQNSDKIADEVAESLGLSSSKYLTRWKREQAEKGVGAFLGHSKLFR